MNSTGIYQGFVISFSLVDCLGSVYQILLDKIYVFLLYLDLYSLDSEDY